jgi:hypothetical protein
MCIEAAICCYIPPKVENIIIRLQVDTTAPIAKDKLSSHRNAIQKGLLLLHDVPSGWNLRFLDVHWPDRSNIRDIEGVPEYAVSKTGVKVHVWHLGKVFHTFG